MAMAATEGSARVRERQQLVVESVRNARCRFEVWERSCEDRMEKLQDMSHFRESYGVSEDLRRQLQLLNDRKGQKETEISSRLQQQEALKKMIEQANERRSYLMKRFELLKDRRRAHAHVANESLNDIEERLIHKQRKVNAQNDAIKWYNNVLGIRAEFSSAIKFIFTKINPTNLQQEFSCTIRLDKHTNKYAMLDCVPYVKKSPDLVDDLNISNEFFDFLRLMRQEFEKIVEEVEMRENAVAEWCSGQLQTTIESRVL